MNANKFIVIIPARYASTRFPGKPLAKIGDKTMIERVWRQTSKAIDNVWVATDDDRIAQEVERFGGKVIMTSPDHPSGTDRICEAACKVASPVNIIINVQGDEPFIAPEQILALKDCFSDESTSLATLVRPFPAEKGFKALADPNLVKVIMSENGNALYFSRSVIPFCRGVETEDWPSKHKYFTHIGMYAYRYDTLMQIARLSRTPLEKAESLEQLRWLENGLTIRTAVSEAPTIGIDTPDDLRNAIDFFNQNKERYE